MASRMTIEQLAAASGMTVRNIREHQSRGLLAPPSVQGRKGWYDERHVSRLALIQQLQDEGLNLQAIQRLLQRPPASSSGEVSRFKQALFAPWFEEAPETYTTDELVGQLGTTGHEVAARAQRLGLLRPMGADRWEVPSPRLLGVVREFLELDVPVDAALDLFDDLQREADAIAMAFVDFFLERVWRPFDPQAPHAAEEWRRVGAALERLRPVVIDTLLTVFGRAMTAAVTARTARCDDVPAQAPRSAGEVAEATGAS